MTIPTCECCGKPITQSGPMVRVDVPGERYEIMTWSRILERHETRVVTRVEMRAFLTEMAIPEDEHEHMLDTLDMMS